MNHIKFKTFLEEVKEIKKDKEVKEFDQTPYVKDALEWLKKKFPEEEYGFSYKHEPKLANPTKTYSVTINNREFDIAGRIFDKNKNDIEDAGDVVLFKIVPIIDDEEQTKDAF